MRLPEWRTPHGGFGKALDAPVERGFDLLFAIDRARAIAGDGQHPIGEIGAAGGVRIVMHVEPRRAQPVAFFLGQIARIDHRLRHQRGARARAGQIPGGCKAGRRLEQAGQHRRLRHGEARGHAIKIMASGRAQAIDIVTEIDVGEIALHDLILGQPDLQPERDQRLARLAAKRPVA